MSAHLGSQIRLSPPSQSAAMNIDPNLPPPISAVRNHNSGNNRLNSPRIRLSPPSDSTDRNNSNNNGGKDLDQLRGNSSRITLSPPSSTAATNLRPSNSTDRNNSNNNGGKDLDQLSGNSTSQIRLSPPPSSAAADSTGKDKEGDNSNSGEKHGENEECLTPTTAEHKIPKILCCPPAPRKPRTSTNISCKRKLEFFEIINHEQLDQFFRSNYDLIFQRRCTRNI